MSSSPLAWLASPPSSYEVILSLDDKALPRRLKSAFLLFRHRKQNHKAVLEGALASKAISAISSSGVSIFR